MRRGDDCKHQCSPELRPDGMANQCESLINVVIDTEPKVLIGSAVVRFRGSQFS